MAIGTTGTLDPVTGERRETQFEYTPVDPQQEMMRQAAQQAQQAFYPPPPQPRGPTPYWENPETYYPRQQQIDPIAQAKAATMAAQKFIAFRGYQSDLKEGMAAADAFAKWGPMLVQDTSFGPSMKAVRPPATYKFNEATRAYEPQGGEGRPVFQPAGSQRADVDPELNVRKLAGQDVYVNPRTGALTKLAGGRGNEITPTAALNVISDPQKWAFAQDALGTDATNLVNIAKAGLPKSTSAPSAPVSVEQAGAQAPQGPITITSKAEFDKLPSGAIYLNKGKPYRKP